jgi:hypothetical protein
MKPIAERVLDALQKLGPMTYDELVAGTVRACWKAKDASVVNLQRALDGLRDSGRIELNGRLFRPKS